MKKIEFTEKGVKYTLKEQYYHKRFRNKLFGIFVPATVIDESNRLYFIAQYPQMFETDEVEVTQEPLTDVKTPSFEEVKEYFVSKGFSEDLATDFYVHFEDLREKSNLDYWIDENGKEVKGWKQKASMVWMKPKK